jgi:hypothetical protein
VPVNNSCAKQIEGQHPVVQIEEIWEYLMGKTISKYTEKIQIINQTLFITTTVALKTNSFQKDKIRQRVERWGKAD